MGGLNDLAQPRFPSEVEYQLFTCLTVFRKPMGCIINMFDVRKGRSYSSC